MSYVDDVTTIENLETQDGSINNVCVLDTSQSNINHPYSLNKSSDIDTKETKNRNDDRENSPEPSSENNYQLIEDEKYGTEACDEQGAEPFVIKTISNEKINGILREGTYYDLIDDEKCKKIKEYGGNNLTEEDLIEAKTFSLEKIPKDKNFYCFYYLLCFVIMSKRIGIDHVTEYKALSKYRKTLVGRKKDNYYRFKTFESAAFHFLKYRYHDLSSNEKSEKKFELLLKDFINTANDVIANGKKFKKTKVVFSKKLRRQIKLVRELYKWRNLRAVVDHLKENLVTLHRIYSNLKP